MGAGASTSDPVFKKQLKQIAKDGDLFDRDFKTLEGSSPQNLTEQLSALQDQIREQKDQERVAAQQDDYDQAKKCKEEAEKLNEGVSKLITNREEQARLIAEAWRLHEIYEAGRAFYKQKAEYEKAKDAFEKRNAIRKQRDQLIEWQLGTVGKGNFDGLKTAAALASSGAVAPNPASSAGGLDLKWADWRSGKMPLQGPDRAKMEQQRKQKVFGHIFYRSLAPPTPRSPAKINTPASRIYNGVHSAYRMQSTTGR
jgi:hypothetical protein